MSIKGLSEGLEIRRIIFEEIFLLKELSDEGGDVISAR
jgi:hypothetical protein